MMGLLKNALLVGTSAAVGFGMIEAAIRVAARFDYDIRYLATAGAEKRPRTFTSLQEFLGTRRPYIEPHRNWNNYYTNGLGFNDREVAVEKPAGTLRVMALGDSFLYGMVAYPRNVLTLVEEALAAQCDRPVEIMNFGIPASGLWEYRWVHKLAAPTYRPDRVIIHYFMGNDGPDLFHGRTDLPGNNGGARVSSYAWTYLVNSVRVLRSIEFPNKAVASARATADTHGPIRGGTRANDLPEVSDREMGPSFTEEAYARPAAAQLARFYSGRNRLHFDPWARTLEVLDLLRAEVTASTGHPPTIVLYPSELQVYPELFEETWRRSEKYFPGAGQHDFDPQVPNRVLAEYCRRSGIRCHDLTPALVEAARASPEPLYRLRDSHWNIRGNAVGAAAEAVLLRNELCGDQ